MILYKNLLARVLKNVDSIIPRMSLAVILVQALPSCSHKNNDDPESDKLCFAEEGTVEIKDNSVFLCDKYTGGSIFSRPSDKTYWQRQLTCNDFEFPPILEKNRRYGTCANAQGDIKDSAVAFCSESALGRWFEATSGTDKGFFYFLCTMDFNVRGIPSSGPIDEPGRKNGPFQFCKGAVRAAIPTDRSQPVCPDEELVGKIFQ